MASLQKQISTAQGISFENNFIDQYQHEVVHRKIYAHHPKKRFNALLYNEDVRFSPSLDGIMSQIQFLFFFVNLPSLDIMSRMYSYSLSGKGWLFHDIVDVTSRASPGSRL
jgi:hypothetical protein